MAAKTKTTKKDKNNKSTKDCEPSKVINDCGKHVFGEKEVENIQENLLRWYDKEQRTLPWRDIAKSEADENIRGYAVWVSEVMLQQTQVATVIPYFNKWMEKWPTVKELAEAKLEEVLQAWAGLGYYSRGRRLHEGAKIIVEKLQGQIPKTVPELMKLIPGIGAYSASAIASVAFQKVAGVVDGNVIRVLSRMQVLGSHVSAPGVRDHLWEQANNLVSSNRPGDFNQALMELGAMICTPQSPNCAVCPVSANCNAYSMMKSSSKTGAMDNFLRKKSNQNKILIKDENSDITDIENVTGCNFCLPSSVWQKNPQVTAFPCKVEKKSPRKETVNVIVIEQVEKFLTTRRPEKGLLASLLEFPSVELEGASQNAISSAMQSLMKELGVPNSELKFKQHVGEVVHLFSHIHTTYVVDHLVLNSSVKIKVPKKEVIWITEEEIKTAAISTAMKKVFSLVKKSAIKSPKQNGGHKRKRSSDDSKQKSIKSFFS